MKVMYSENCECKGQSSRLTMCSMEKIVVTVIYKVVESEVKGCLVIYSAVKSVQITDSGILCLSRRWQGKKW